MSVEDLKKYGQMAAENEEVREKAKSIGLQDIDGQIAYAKTLGLEFTKEDMEALSKEVGAGQSDELSEEDLEKVAGGAVTTTGAAVAGMAAGVATTSLAVGKMVTGATGKW